MNNAKRATRVCGPAVIANLLLCLMLAGCSLIPVQYDLPAVGDLDCSMMVADLDADIRRYTHFDPALHRIPGQPLLRSNRFVASFASSTLQGDALRDWLRQMNTLAQEAYAIEFQRLPSNVQNTWQARFPALGVAGALRQCSEAFLSAPPSDIATLIENVQPSSNYSSAQRFWGVYPLTKRLAASSIEEYRTEMTKRITNGDKQQFNQSRRYALAPVSQHENSTAMSTLFRQHAPELWVENNSAADQLGAPVWHNDESIGLEATTPRAYTYITYMRYKQQILTQLNYVFWFAARPKTSWADLYGGDLDAVVWRVTLNVHGNPVLYDSIHACGCYHLLFLPPGTQIDSSKIQGEKPLSFVLSAQRVKPVSGTSKTLRLKIDSGTHYLIDAALIDVTAIGAHNATNAHAFVAKKAAEFDRYEFQPYQQLLMLPTTSGRRSLFGADGIIAQSSRLERFVLWPLGIPNAGAMRQAGTHAIAFIGERHFDDAWLLDQLGVSFTEE